MKRFAVPRSLIFAALPAAMVALALTGGLVDARQADDAQVRAASVTAAERMESDAALAWVDPVVTGPVSPEFRRERAMAGCDDAKWPHIPAVCYPK